MSTFYDNSGSLGDSFANPLVAQTGASFKTDAVGGTLASVSIYLSVQGSPFNFSDVSIDLFNDNGGPGIGALVQNIALINGLNPYPAFPTVFAVAIPVTPLTRYWIVVTPQPDDNQTQWNFANDDAGTGVATEFNSFGGTVASNASGPNALLMIIKSGGTPPLVIKRSPILPASFHALGWPNRSNKNFFKGVKHG